jgi:hypothetical protein
LSPSPKRAASQPRGLGCHPEARSQIGGPVWQKLRKRRENWRAGDTRGGHAGDMRAWRSAGRRRRCHGAPGPPGQRHRCRQLQSVRVGVSADLRGAGGRSQGHEAEAPSPHTRDGGPSSFAPPGGGALGHLPHTQARPGGKRTSHLGSYCSYDAALAPILRAMSQSPPPGHWHGRGGQCRWQDIQGTQHAAGPHAPGSQTKASASVASASVSTGSAAGRTPADIASWHCWRCWQRALPLGRRTAVLTMFFLCAGKAGHRRLVRAGII